MDKEDYWVKKQQFTKTVYRDVYPAIDPPSASNSQAGKVVVITGASRGLGRLVGVPLLSPLKIADFGRLSSILLPKPVRRPSL